MSVQTLLMFVKVGNPLPNHYKREVKLRKLKLKQQDIVKKYFFNKKDVHPKKRDCYSSSNKRE
jgi:hypothetical protein